MLRQTPLMTWGMVLALSLPAFGQFDALGELYGNGVHAYNGANYVEAYNEFTRAIENGSEDPRVYYYRGLSFLKLGRPQEAQHDFADGAKREMADSDRFYNVSKALERVQGRPRAMLERYRAAARLAAFHEREQARFERYERIRQNEPNVLLKTAPGEKPAAEEPAAEEMPAEEASDQPAPAEKPEAEMTDDEAPPPAEADPFGGDKPAEEKPEAKEPADEAAPKDDAETSTMPGKKIPAGRLAKGLFGSLARGAMKTAAGQPAAGQAAPAEKPADNAAAPAEKPASDDPFAN